MSTITTHRLREMLSYDPKTGVFQWRIKRRGPVKEQAGGLNAKGYRVISIDDRQYKASRLAWLYVHGFWPAGLIDHKNHDPADNRIANLRDVSTRVNTENQIRAQKRSTCGLLGVERRRDKWVAKISVKGKRVYLGLFDAPDQAHSAYVKAKRQLHEGNTL